MKNYDFNSNGQNNNSSSQNNSQKKQQQQQPANDQPQQPKEQPPQSKAFGFTFGPGYASKPQPGDFPADGPGTLDLGGGFFVEPALPMEVTAFHPDDHTLIRDLKLVMNRKAIVGELVTWRSKWDYWSRPENHLN